MRFSPVGSTVLAAYDGRATIEVDGEVAEASVILESWSEVGTTLKGWAGIVAFDDGPEGAMEWRALESGTVTIKIGSRSAPAAFLGSGVLAGRRPGPPPFGPE